MRTLLLGAAAIALSGCSWLGGSNHHSSSTYNGYNQGYYSGQHTTKHKQDPCCVGGKRLARWNLEGAIGPEFIVGGDIITGDEINAIPGVTSENVSFDTGYEDGMRYELGGSYALNPNRKVTLMGNYAKAEGNDVILGSINDRNVTGQLSDYERYGVEVGLRQYFTPTSAPVFGSVRPYVEGRVGAAHVDDIALENATYRNNPYNGGNVNLYEGGWVPTGAGLVGVEAPVFNRATLGLETGVRYTGLLKTDTSDLTTSVPLAGSNNGSASWTVPVMLRGRYRF